MFRALVSVLKICLATLGSNTTALEIKTNRKSGPHNEILILWITTNWKILKEMGMPDHLTCLLRNLYTGQETTIRIGHGTTDLFQIEKEVCQGCILSPCLINLYAEYIMQNARLDEAQAGIKIVRRNINNLRYADDTTLKAKSEEEVKSLLMKLKE